MKLPRFQFRLRTLMIAITLMAVSLGYVGWQARIVRERTTMKLSISADYSGLMFKSVPRVPAPSQIPWLRRLLGDDEISFIELPRNTSVENRRLIKSYFPDAALKWRLSSGNHAPFAEDQEPPPATP